MVAGVLWKKQLERKGSILGLGYTVHHDRESLLAGRAPVHAVGA